MGHRLPRLIGGKKEITIELADRVEIPPALSHRSVNHPEKGLE